MILLRIRIRLDWKVASLEWDLWFIILWKLILMLVFDRILSILKVILAPSIYLHHLVFLHSIKLIMILIIIVFILIGVTVSKISTIAITVLKFTIYCLTFKIMFLDYGLIFIIFRIVMVFKPKVLIFWHCKRLWASPLVLDVAFVFIILLGGRWIIIELAFCNFNVWIWRLSEILFLRLLRMFFALFMTFTFPSRRALFFLFFVFWWAFRIRIMHLRLFLLFRILFFARSPRILLLFIFLKWIRWLWIRKTSWRFYIF